MSYEMDERDTRELSGELDKKRRVFGVLCPKRNRTGDTCKECDRAELLWGRGDKDSQDIARGKFAKPSFFITAMLEDGTFTAMKLGKQVAKEILDEFDNYTGWGFADPDEGRWVRISKRGDYPNFEYRFNVLPDDAPAVEKEKMANLPYLNDIKNSYLEGKVDVLDIANHLQSGTSLKFRMLPTPKENGKFNKMTFQYYHWRCTEADILGGLEATDMYSQNGEELPDEDYSEFMGTEDTPTGSNEFQETTTTKTEESDMPKCYGNFDADPDDCLTKECDEWREGCVKKTNEDLDVNWRMTKKGWVNK